MENKTRPEESERKSHRAGKVTILIVLALAIASVLYLKTRHDAPGSASSEISPLAAGTLMKMPPETEPGPKPVPVELPRLIDLGADKCVPCKMMAPILEELREEYRGRFEVVFIDVWKDPQPGRQYKIRVIPTQIFFDPSGKELFRHEGFFSKEDILDKWKELGVDI